jgi:hypothetical protein
MSTPDYVRAARSRPCPYCGVAAGRPCRSKSGRATLTHSDRTRESQLAFRIGVETGLNDALKMFDWAAKKRGVNATVGDVRKPIEDQLGWMVKSNARDEARLREVTP